VGGATANHLPGGVDLREAEVDGFSESAYDGVGFGLGFAVTLNPLASKMIANHGNFYWGGMASTAFFVDPTEQLTVQFFTQLIPSTTYPIRPELSQLVYQAIVE
jgi:CubicO group peptidase (beta-lactamase class C family)